jgi:signal transduction histidine kinase
VPRIFDRFFRGDRTRSRGNGGAGLGLAIARWIVESHGGKIRAESSLGQGTKIYVSLPVR